VVVGPGMGRDAAMLSSVSRILDALLTRPRDRAIPLVLDADALYLVAQRPDMLRRAQVPGCVVLTPNPVEYARLAEAVGKDAEVSPHELARELGGVALVRKGRVDTLVAAVGDETGSSDSELACSVSGGLRRFGGQGDVLSGAIATFAAWQRCVLPVALQVGRESEGN